MREGTIRTAGGVASLERQLVNSQGPEIEATYSCTYIYVRPFIEAV